VKKGTDVKVEQKRKLGQSNTSFPSANQSQEELAKVARMDEFFGRDGVFAKLFSETLERMMEAELTDHLGYEKYEPKGRNSGNSRNGKTEKKVHTSAGDIAIHVPRDRNSEYEPKVLPKHHTSSQELEEKIISFYAKGLSTRDIQSMLGELYGVEVSPSTISAVTDKVWSLVEAWQNRPLAAIYPVVYLDALHLKIRREGKVSNTALYVVLGVDLDGQRDVLGHWLGNGSEGANFWLSVISDLQARGVEDIFIACVDGLNGFRDAIHSIFPRTHVQRCIVHQIRHSLKYVSWKDRKDFATELKRIYQAPTREAAEHALESISEQWGKKYAMAVRAWETSWTDLTTMFDFPCDIRRLIYTTNVVESYHSQLRRVLKTKSSFPTEEAARKLLFLVSREITNKWSASMFNWPLILNQIAILFEDRL
jgi:transposase-like protein